MKGLITLALLLGTIASASCQNIAAIYFEGLTKTKETFLRSIIKSEEGIEYDSLQFKADVQNIKNLNLFFDVRTQVKEDEGNYILEIVCKEALSIYPILDFGIEKANNYFQLGASDINWLGYGNTLGAFYRYYGRHSFAIYQKTPRHKNLKTGHAVSIAKYSTIEPLYFSQGTRDFNYDLYSANITGLINLNYFNTIEIGNTYFYEKYKNVSGKSIVNLEGTEFAFHKQQFKLGYLLNVLNFDYERLDGWKAYVAVEDIYTYDVKSNFVKITTDLRYHRVVGKKGNIAIRHKFGMGTNNKSPFSPFVLDNYQNVRGIGNRVARGTGEMIFNIEYRHTLFNHSKVIIQSNSFLDIGVLRTSGQPFEDILDNSVHKFVGLGIRFHSRVIYNSIIRLDYGFDLSDFKTNGFVFGMGQYF